MNRLTRISVLILSLSLVIAFFVPIWKINLQAPQYPEGLGMKIWIDKLSGDINTINGLNHYIGMQFIVEDSIPELKYMPYLLGFLIAFGVLTALTKKRALLYTWVILFVTLGVVGGTDFYMWEYDYGHNLDPRAPIKVEGMSYQPPLLGSKQLLNFTADSYPDVGGYIILSAAFIAILLMLFNLLKKRRINVPSINAESFDKPMAKAFHIFITLAIASTMPSCDFKPQPINYGVEHCDYCKMGISDERFGAEFITAKGKVYKFDALECMVNYMEMKGVDRDKEVKHLLVANAAQKRSLVPAASAFYLLSEELPSPMGSNISAYGSEAEVVSFQKDFPGQRMTWEEVVRKVKR